MGELILQYWPVLVVAGSVVVWGLRLESLAMRNRSDIQHLNDRVDRQDNDIRERLGKIDARLESIANSIERVIWRFSRNQDNDNSDSN